MYQAFKQSSSFSLVLKTRSRQKRWCLERYDRRRQVTKICIYWFYMYNSSKEFFNYSSKASMFVFQQKTNE
jgi:hypothetical protein